MPRPKNIQLLVWRSPQSITLTMQRTRVGGEGEMNGGRLGTSIKGVQYPHIARMMSRDGVTAYTDRYRTGI